MVRRTAEEGGRVDGSTKARRAPEKGLRVRGLCDDGMAIPRARGGVPGFGKGKRPRQGMGCTAPFGKDCRRRRKTLFAMDISRNGGDNDISPGLRKADGRVAPRVWKTWI